jgi:hypothetical protein
VEKLIVTIHDLARGGAGVAKLDSGEIVFVPFTAPGDKVSVQIHKRKKNYSHGTLVEILEPSPLRVTPKCPSFTQCGGCTWQHLPYSLQFETKKKGLLQALKRASIFIEGIPFDEMPAENEYFYRNRIQLKGNPKTKEIGFFERGTQTLTPIQTCSITDQRINDRLGSLAKEGFDRFQDHFKLELDLAPTGEVRAAWDQKNAAFGFRQVNDTQNSKLKDWVTRHIAPADLLFDLYGGDGNLSLSLASQFDRVFCVDLFTPKTGLEPTPANFQYDRRDINQWARSALPQGLLGKTTSLILDPPREGIGQSFETIQYKISKITVNSAILVSCDVDSFTRDSLSFLQSGYKLKHLGALDLFPQTPHLECLALFSK